MRCFNFQRFLSHLELFVGRLDAIYLMTTLRLCSTLDRWLAYRFGYHERAL
jgi:hypothetical protein